MCFCAFHLILNFTHGSFGHHALKCVIGGPFVKNHTPLSLKHDKGVVVQTLSCKCIAMRCLFSVAAK